MQQFLRAVNVYVLPEENMVLGQYCTNFYSTKVSKKKKSIYLKLLLEYYKYTTKYFKLVVHSYKMKKLKTLTMSQIFFVFHDFCSVEEYWLVFCRVFFNLS